MENNSIPIHKDSDFEGMRKAGKLTSYILDQLDDLIKPGIRTNEINDFCHKLIIKNNAIPAPLNYKGFPKSVCTSVNHVVCHGIPDDTPLKDGDIINIDITVIKDGYHGDTSKMFLVGDVSPEDGRLCRITQEALYVGLKKVKPGVAFGEIGTAIQKFIKKSGRFSIVKEYCGHGIGKEFHEEPQIVHYKNNEKTKMAEGMCFTIEPMINLGSYKTKLSKTDGWTVETTDGRLSAQWEHTILVTQDGFEVLTQRGEESF